MLAAGNFLPLAPRAAHYGTAYDALAAGRARRHCVPLVDSVN